MENRASESIKNEGLKTKKKEEIEAVKETPKRPENLKK
jgi:hypothetical protein